MCGEILLFTNTSTKTGRWSGFETLKLGGGQGLKGRLTDDVDVFDERRKDD
jgi:hypothetical protein